MTKIYIHLNFRHVSELCTKKTLYYHLVTFILSFFKFVHIDASFRIGPCGISAQLRAEAQNDLRKSHDMLRKCTDRAEFPHH